jgi:hypothetical protein
VRAVFDIVRGERFAVTVIKSVAMRLLSIAGSGVAAVLVVGRQAVGEGERRRVEVAALSIGWRTAD